LDIQIRKFDRQLLDLIRVPVFAQQPDGTIIYWNRGAAKLYGFSRAEAVGAFCQDLLKTVFPVSYAEFMTKLERDSRWVGELTHTTRDGRQVTVESRLQVIDLDDGHPAVLQTTRDTGAIKTRYRLLFEGMQEGVAYCRMIYNAQGRLLDWIYLDVNPALETLCGTRDIPGKRASELHPGLVETSPELIGMLERVEQSGAPENYEGYLKALSMWVRVSAFRPEKDHIVLIGENIGARKQAEETLRESEARLRLALEGAEMGTWEWNLDTDRLLWDERQFAIFGVDPGAFNGYGASIVGRIHPEDRTRLKDAIASAVDRSAQFREEFRVVHGDGGVRWLAGRGITLPPAADGSRRMIGVNFDITARKEDELAREHRHEEEMARLYRIGTVNELASGLAHELSQPLTAIQNYAGGSLKWLADGGDPQAIRSALEAIETQSGRVVEIIKHLRRLMTTGEPQRAPTDLNAIVTRARELLKIPLARKNVRINLALAPDLPMASVDALQIEQVVIILMRNCIDAFRGEYLANPTIVLHTAAQTDGSVEVAVSDNGPGVAPEVLEHMFDPFYTTKEKGLGLGLMLARSIVRAHNGQIQARPKSDVGLTVQFSLPVDGG
jgi:PAS domain S-box-containing protein